MKRSTYITSILKEHLSKTETYQRISPHQANELILKTNNEIKNTFISFEDDLIDAERNFFYRSFDQQYRAPLFYGPPKLHKKQTTNYIKTRPVVAKINSFVEIASKFVDYHLTSLFPFVTTYLKDSFTLLHELQHIKQPLHPKYKLLTIDAIGMYTNISTSHGLATLEKFIKKHEHKIKKHFPTDFIIQLLQIVMENNIFRFGDLWFKQLNGTAMGTISAVKYATLYCALHEEEYIIPKYKNQLLYFKRYIDDIIIIWDDSGQYSWNTLVQDLKFGILEWEAKAPSYSINFLDLNIKINKKGIIQTKTYEKELHLHNYLPAHSCHPQNVAKGLIIGFFIRYWLQNSNIYYFKLQVKKFAQRLRKRGYDHDFISRTFLEAGTYLQKKYNNQRIFISKNNINRNKIPDTTLLFHREHHPRSLPPRAIKDAFKRAFKDTNIYNKLMICNSRPKNIRDVLMPSDLKPLEGHDPSDYLNKLQS